MEKTTSPQSVTYKKTNVVSLEKGKVPPQAVDLEEVVLGAMMIDKKGVDEIIDILHPEAFYKNAHKLIYGAIKKLFDSSEAIDLLTVSNQLKKDGAFDKAGGDYYLIQLTQKVSSSAHIEFHARIILQKYIQRSLIKISNEIIEEAFDEGADVFDLLDNAEAKLYEVTQGNIKRSTETAQSLVIQAKKKIQEISNKEGLSGVPSGFDKLDELTSGWQPSDLIIVAARPGMGKTALTLSMARNIAVDQGIPVAFFSLEMSSVQLITRLISSETGLSSEKLRTGKLEQHEWEQLNVKVKDLEKAPLFIDDTPSLSMARNIAVDQGIPVAFFSLEMSSVQLITRLISSETGLSSEKLRTGKLEQHEWEQLNVKVKDLEKAPLFIDDTPSLSIFDLRAKARRLASQHGIRMIVIDYLQLMTAGGSQKGGGNREQEISTISRNLKALAKELNVPVIALSQLSRAVETRGGSKRPLLSDLRESGAIEQDADIVSFIYRPEYYKIEEWDDEERSPTQGQGEFIVAKHRNGGLENIRLKFIGELGKFDNLEDFNFPSEIPSSMNSGEGDSDFGNFNLPNPSADEAFGSSMNSNFDDDDNDVPF